MGVSAIVVTYNRLSLLKDCLSHLLNQSYKLDKIFVVNNNSTDGTKTYLDNLHNKRIVVKTLKKNLGGAGGFHFGTKMAFEQSSSDYFWIMDDDTMPTPSALEKLMEAAKKLKYNFGFLSSNVRWWKDKGATNIPKVNKFWTESAQDGLIRLDSATFVSFLFPRTEVAKKGLPITKMFLWGDDIEYSTRLSTDKRSYFVSNSIVLHKSAMNRFDETIFNDLPGRIKFNKCGYRNTLFIDRKYYPPRYFLKDLMLFTYYLLILPFKAKDHRWEREYCLFMGIIKGLFFHPKVTFPNKKN